MSPSVFSETYAEAREKFLNAASEAGASIRSYQHPSETGPHGESLYLDAAFAGNMNARKVLVVGSGTHGIEGYSGSAAQTHWLNLHGHTLPADVAVLMLHAHNPWGFAHALRFTEENVDLNRNFVDFSAPLPENPQYERVHEAISLKCWDESSVDSMFEALDRIREDIGEQAFSDAFNGGQYTHADGIFYGGVREQWSNRAFRGALSEHLGNATEVAMIDFHTGIGPERGHVFLCFHESGSASYERARAYWGERAVNREGVTHKAIAKYQGLLVDAFVNSLPHAETTAVVVEFGTLPRRAMQRASMAARWLRTATADSRLRAGLMSSIREAFYPNAPDWREGVLRQSGEIVNQAVAGLRDGKR
ncbi:deacylase [Pandoraea anhela]|uniref:Deacylase n=2 Tax=Pandoraea anhela TaxID=2508295 RepID=A0A5E4YT94_9BURK|nr:deacylase [Pandoraea anhela]